MEIAGQWEMSYRTGAGPGSALSFCCNNKFIEISELTTQMVRISVGADRIRDKTPDADYCSLPNQLSFSCS